MRIGSTDYVAVDTFVSTSGRWRCFLTEAYRPMNTIAGGGTLRWYEMVSVRSDGEKFKKTLGGNLKEAFDAWTEIKDRMTAAPSGPEERNDEWQVMPFGNRNFTQKEADMLKTYPGDVKMIVRDIVPTDEITARAEAAGLVAVIAEGNKPRSTMGLILKVGKGITEHYAPGNVVIFSHNSGTGLMENNQQYRILGDFEIIGNRFKEDGFEDLNLLDEDMSDLGLKDVAQ